MGHALCTFVKVLGFRTPFPLSTNSHILQMLLVETTKSLNYHIDLPVSGQVGEDCDEGGDGDDHQQDGHAEPLTIEGQIGHKFSGFLTVCKVLLHSPEL